MTVPSGRSLGQEINTWVTTFGILIAAAWGGYTFFYKEILLPNSAPVNISIDLQLKKIGQMGPNGAHVNEASDRPNGAQEIEKKKQLIAVEMRMSAINPSPRDVYLLPSTWVAVGIVDKMSDQGLPDERAEEVLNEMPGEYIQKHSDSVETSIVAIGGILPDAGLRPNERAGRTEIIYVPAGRYDRIMVRAVLITMSKQLNRVVKWKMQDNVPIPHLYRVGANNEQIEIENPEEEPDIYQFQYASGQISLWQ